MNADKHNFVYFGLKGEFDPEEVAAEIGLMPSKSAAKHAVDPERKHPRLSILRFAQTHADADADPNLLDFYCLAEQVVDQLESFASHLHAVAERHNACATFQLVLAVSMSDGISTPAIGFSQRVIQFIAAAGASIDIDTYRRW